jgi:glycine cleavage system aminomethyltransferase T
MVTQELKGFAPWTVKRSFWLNRKGRIDGDVRLIELAGTMNMELDIHAAARTLQGLAAFIITEEVQIKDVTERTHRLALHGPTSAALLAAVSKPVSGAAVDDLKPDQACTISIAGTDASSFEMTRPARSASSFRLPAEHGAAGVPTASGDWSRPRRWR